MIYINGVGQVGVGDMTKAVYDPNEDGIIDMDELEAAVCSETEADGKITTHGISSKHRWTLNKLRKGAGAAADPTEIDVPTAVYKILTGDLSGEPAATGDVTNPERLNDGLVVDSIEFDVNEYAQILFNHIYQLNQFRIYKTLEGGSANDAEFKLQYRNPLTQGWVDWVTGKVVPLDAAEWMAWDSSGGTIQCDGIKVICTKVDTSMSHGWLRELELKYA